MSTTKATCSKCGTRVATLDGNEVTYFGMPPSRPRRGKPIESRTHALSSDFMKATRRGDVVPHCPNPKCRQEYVMADVVSKLQRAKGGASTKLSAPHSGD